MLKFTNTLKKENLMQVNFRIDPQMAAQIDALRVEMLADLGRIPTRSELIRMAVEQFLDSHKKPEKQ